jgi:chemotaxis signal transduction protein
LRRRKWQVCSICAAASSPPSIFAAAWDFRHAPMGARRWRSVEERGELYGLIVDRVGDVLRLKPSSYEANPVNLDQRWTKVCAGVHRLDHGLMVVLDVDKVLDLSKFGVAA